MFNFRSPIGLLFLCVVGVLGAALAERQTCPITEVDQYRYSCRLNGTVQRPTYLKRSKGVASIQTCAGACLANLKCHSFRYLDGNGACDLYEYHLENMNFTVKVKTPGIYSDRYCYSNNCNEISACQAINACRSEVAGHSYYHFKEYGCGYGVTSTFDPKAKQYFLNGTLTACDATKECSNIGPAFGPFEVHYDLSSQQWVCLTDHAFGDIYGDLTLKENKVNYTTFTVKNATVGASYAYWCSYIYG